MGACWPRHLHVTSTQRVDAQACHSQEGDIRCDIPSAIADMFSASSCRPCLHQAPLLVHAHDTVFAIAAMSSSCRPCHRPCRPHAPGGVHMPQFLSCANVAVSSVAANALTSIRHSIRHGEFSFISSAISSISTCTPEIRRPRGFHTPLSCVCVCVCVCVRARACMRAYCSGSQVTPCMHACCTKHTHTHTHTHTQEHLRRISECLCCAQSQRFIYGRGRLSFSYCKYRLLLGLRETRTREGTHRRHWTHWQNSQH